jgi:hypothetical protein
MEYDKIGLLVARAFVRSNTKYGSHTRNVPLREILFIAPSRQERQERQKNLCALCGFARVEAILNHLEIQFGSAGILPACG